MREELSEIARVCTYDRAGILWSEPGEDPRDALSIATELHEILAAATESPPSESVSLLHRTKEAMSKVLHPVALSGYEPEIGHWLWALEEVRRRTLELVRDLDQPTLDWEGPRGRENAIGSLLYHIAHVEMSWLFMDVLLREVPQSIKTAFPHEMATEGRIARMLGVDLTEHVERLDRSRSVFLGAFRGMSIEDWNALRDPSDVDYQVSPAWVVFHLVEHESGHAAQISAMKTRAGRANLVG